ncbi:MAG: gamma-glutamyl-gamma-aminobutyrate hydrolase family protein [Alphaproteobacteria bacterium]|nr:MAG: gamma-glutamyl-gamma-aminobutyrate hydrolase family protein [Alphaproteobacteria bacterium]
MKPLIGITLDWQKDGSFSTRPHYALRTHYFDAVAAAGGLGFGIPYQTDMIADYVARCDGFLSPGGECASPAEWYVAEEQKDGKGGSPYDVSPRVVFELALTRAFLDAGKPVLGICQGMQQLGGMHGCKMTGDVHSYLKTEINHAPGVVPPEDYAYDVTIEKDSRLYGITGAETLPVNTAHREALVTAGADVRVSARSADGCIQAIELENHAFAIGIQWHPEYFTKAAERGHQKIFEALVIAAGK